MTVTYRMRLLREYIRALLTEERTPRFSLDQLKKAKDPSEAFAYAQKTLPQIGEGSSRTVFRLGNSKVLKVAQDDYMGTAQNQAEMEIFTDPRIKPITTRIFDYDRNYLWLVSELVRPLSSHDEFQRMTGFEWHFFMECLHERKLPEGWDPSDTQQEFWNACLGLLESNLEPGDMWVLNHWGKTASGRIVILDYGYTKNVRAQRTGKAPIRGESPPTWNNWNV